MEGFLLNSLAYLRVLSKASTTQIKEWKIEDLKNAQKWSTFFDKVWQQLGSNKKHLARFNNELLQIVQNHKINLGVTVDCQFLAQSRSFLEKTLLMNPHLPIELFHEMLTCDPDMQKFCAAVIKEMDLYNALTEISTILQTIS